MWLNMRGALVNEYVGYRWHLAFGRGSPVYVLKLPFFSDKRRELLDFSPEDRLQPVLLHKCTFHPDMPSLAFVGVYRGPFFGVMELQARWACAVISDSRSLPPRDVMLNAIDGERQIRM